MTNDGRTYSLADLPNEILADITFRMARLSVKDGASLGKISQAFRMHWNTEAVQRESHRGPLEFEPAIRDNEEIRSLAVAVTRFCVAGNPKALYREGFNSYFDNQRRERANERLALLEAAAEKCHIKARYLYDLILVCWGVDRRKIRDEGFDMLAMLMKPLLLESVIEVTVVRNSLVLDLDLLWEGGDKSKDMVLDYDSDCSFDEVLNKDYMDNPFEWIADAVDSMIPLMLRCVRNVFGPVKPL